jgi:hypothetical protein
VGLRSGLDAVEKEKHIALAGNRTPVVQAVARRYTDFLELYLLPFPTPYLISNIP